MDFSKKYLTMCKTAAQLQNDIKELLPVPFGAMYLTSENKINFNKANKIDDIIKNKYIWIPRVDELFDVMKWRGKSMLDNLLTLLNDVVAYPTLDKHITTEQMMICVVMMERYKKEWDEEAFIWVSLKVYGIGTPGENESMAMAAGPDRDIKLLLGYPISQAMMDDNPDWYIINLITNNKVYKWNKESSEWMLIEN